MNFEMDFIDENTQNRLVLRIRPWNRRDFIYGMPGLLVGALILTYSGMLMTSRWRYGAFFVAFWLAASVVMMVWDMAEDVKWVFDRNKGTVVQSYYRPPFASMCRNKATQMYALTDIRGVEVEERMLQAGYAQAPFYRVIMRMAPSPSGDGPELVALRGHIFDPDRAGKEKHMRAIEAFLSHRSV